MPESVGFSFIKVVTNQFDLNESEFKDKMDIGFNVDVKFGLNEKDKIIAVIFSPAFNQVDKTFLFLDITCHFRISEKSWSDFKKENKLKIPVGFLRHLVVLTIGTARGVLHAKTENTHFNQFLIPTVNVQDLLKDGIVFELETPSKS